MRLELKYKETFQKIQKLLSDFVGGKVEIKPGIWLECPSNLSYRFSKVSDGVLIEFPQAKLKVSASKWLFQMDGYIESVKVKSDKVLVQVSNLPDLEIIFV